MRLLTFFMAVRCLCSCYSTQAQNYQAINGSSYAGSLSPGNNPASIVNVPYTWDITPFAVQVKHATNAYVVNDYSLLSKPSNAKVVAVSGTLKRFELANQNIRLLNTRINLNAVSAIAFGANIRSCVSVTSTALNYRDGMNNSTEFMQMNIGNLPIKAESRGLVWAELYGTYARTIIESGNRILTAGVTLKINRSLAGAYQNLSDINYSLVPDNGNGTRYLLSQGSLQYGYSSNFDEVNNNQSSSANRAAFIKHTMAAISADAGLEYLILDDDADDEDASLAYRTKIGVSLMDVGRNRFRYSSRSSSATAGKPNINDSSIAVAFSNLKSVDDFNTGVASIANSFTSLAGTFNIYQPTRVIVNVDQHLQNNFYLNGELTLAVWPLIPKKFAYVKDMNLLAITPRWETKRWGLYLPVQLNTKNQLWVGGALKAGPLLLGLHNFANLFSKNKMQVGGGYLALIIRPGKNNGGGGEKASKSTRKERQSLECPKL